MDALGGFIQAILFGIFAGLTAILWAITGPTYDGLFVPEMSPASLFPPIAGNDGSFLARASGFAGYLIGHLVDPAVVIVALAIGILYLVRSFLGRDAASLDHLLPRLVVYVVLANITVPVCSAILGLAGSVYPVIAGLDGGAWQNWSNLDAVGGLQFSWDNGALAFVISFVLFSLVLLLAIAVAVRDALLGVLLVILPILTLVGALPALRPIARRAWLMFGEAAFLPCILVVPLELAVGAPSILLLLGYLTIAVGSPSLIASAGSHLTALGFPSAGGALTGGVQRGLSVATLGATSYARTLSSHRTSKAASALTGSLGVASKVPLPVAAPLAVADLVGRGASHLVRHLRRPRPIGSEIDDPIYKRFPTTLRELM
jgi:hypothetical protein